MRVYLLIILALLFLSSCKEKQEPMTTPWGTTINEEVDSLPRGNGFSFSDIVNNGEMIMLTLTGPETYYDYRGRGMGLQYLLCEKFAQQIGVSLRVEVCKDTADMVSRLEKGEGDVIVYPLPKTVRGDLLFCGAETDSTQTQWAVKADNRELADTLNGWFKPELIAQVRQEESYVFSARSVQRRIYSPMLNRSGGVISHYDGYFQQYAPVARVDWRMMAAQCYQESCFDPNARSWAGARGLMQIMPSTAAHLGLSMEKIHEPEANIAAAARYMAELNRLFSDVPDHYQRCYFVLASYNGGPHHIKDAMALTRKYGGNPYSWNDVSQYVLRLREPQYYQDPIVKNGYMRGNETYEYVARIRDRWAQYRGVAKPGSSFTNKTPTKATKKHRFHI